MTFGSSRRIFLALAAALALAGPALAAPPASEPDDMALGNPKAPVTVIEYASASCPHCALFNNDVFPAFKKKYVDTGKVHYVFREFLTQPVEVAAMGFLLARCAGPAKYFHVLDAYFHDLQHAYDTHDDKGLVLLAAAAGGLSQDQMAACFNDQAAADALNARVQRHFDDGVNSTPTFIINGEKLPDLNHEVALADLDAAIQPLLKARRR